MTVKLSFQLLVAVVLAAAAARSVQLCIRSRDDLPLRALAPGLLCLAVAKTVNINALELGPRTMPGYAIFGVVINALWLTMACCFACFFVLANAQRPAQVRQRIVVRLLMLLATAVAVSALMCVISPEVFTPEINIADYRRWEHNVSVAMFAGGSLAVRYCRSLTHVWLRWSIRWVIAGVLLMSLVPIVTIIKEIAHIVVPLGPDHPIRFAALSAVYLTGLLAGQAALAVGRLEPDFDGWRGRARWMTEVARALSRAGRDDSRTGSEVNAASS